MFPPTPGPGEEEVREASIDLEPAPPQAATVPGPGHEDQTMEGGIGQGSYKYFLLYFLLLLSDQKNLINVFPTFRERRH